MEVNCKVPPPIKINCWKHHALFIKKEINSLKNDAQLKYLPSRLRQIGESQMDLYFGRSAPEEIANQIITYISSISIKNIEHYYQWLFKNGNEYQIIKLNDTSVWTLRKGDEVNRYVHIHPGRYSPHTVRVKALTLKTAIFVLANSKIQLSSAFDIDLINETRKRFLNLPPLKPVNKEKGLGKLLSLLDNLNV